MKRDWDMVRRVIRRGLNGRDEIFERLLVMREVRRKWRLMRK